MNITKPIIFRSLIHIISFAVAIWVKLYCFISPFVPKLEAKPVVTKMTARDNKHYWWCLLGYVTDRRSLFLTSDLDTGNHCQIASRVTKIVIHDEARNVTNIQIDMGPDTSILVIVATTLTCESLYNDPNLDIKCYNEFHFETHTDIYIYILKCTIVEST